MEPTLLKSSVRSSDILVSSIPMVETPTITKLIYKAKIVNKLSKY